MSSGSNSYPFPTPTSITGGCLCGSVRYRADFPPDHDFLQYSQTCQCTQCRKQTGSLFFAEHVIAPASDAFTLTNEENPTLKAYSISPKAYRWFCSNCGSFLYWQPKEEGKDYICLAVGSIDEVYLVGGENDKGVPTEGYGLALVGGGGEHLWCKNEIKGVTDDIPLLGFKRGTRVLDGGDSS
ncbi:Mss4-like protein [Apiosordaria backusii]|uniref:Mss4-like protein n=1 Tax=Apiosordaria backusii TaxID=314023 RepID=A0AA40E6B0_9PEZI|nr:Mss4-like protein [Apiosordaria backusii]